MGKKLYVGNLPYNATENDIRDLFSEVGEIDDVAIISDRDTGRSKGFGFVEMATEEGAQEAISRFNGYQMSDRPLTVNEARPKPERSGGHWRLELDDNMRPTYVLKALEEAGFDVQQAEFGRASLEQLFMSLTQRSLRDS